MSELYRAFQPLDARLAGDPIDETLFEGAPPHLVAPLEDWIAQVLAKPSNLTLARRVALRLRVEKPDNWSYARAILQFCGNRLHVVADAILQLYGQSAYRLDEDQRRLLRRVDPTTEEAFRITVSGSGEEPAKHFRNAWREAYGLEPDPTAGYREAVRGVEAAACPVVLPNNDKATLGTVIAHLRQAPHKWLGGGKPPGIRIKRRLRPPSTSPRSWCSSCNPT
jgi:hypothetical protein